MSKRSPLVLPDPEPGIRNDHAQTPLPAIVRGSSLFDDLVGSAGGLPIPTERTALTVSAIYACVNLIAGAIASLPMYIYRQTPDGERDRLPSDDLDWLLNEQMTPRWSAPNGWEYQTLGLLLHGDGIAKIKRTRMGEIVGVEPWHPLLVEPIPTPDGQRLVYAFAGDATVPGAKPEVLDQDDVIHVAGFGFNGVRGLSPLRNHLRMTGAVAMATQDYAARFFANGARPDFALQTDSKLDPATVEMLRQQLDERHQGLSRSHRPIVLTNGLKVETISIPAEEMQLLGTRQFAIEEIARIYGIPPFMIGHNEKTTSWGSGVEAMGVGFVRYALRQHLNKFEREINRKFFRRAGKVAAFDTTELERADTKALFEAFRIAIGRAGEDSFMTIEEVRERLNLRRKPSRGTLRKAAPNAPKDPPEPSDPEREEGGVPGGG